MLKSLSLRFDIVEDRLVLRLVADGVEQWLHLTRRVCMQWRQDLQALVDASAQLPQRLDASARASVSQAHHQAMASQATVRREPVAEPPPTAVVPQLVTGIACGQRRRDGRWVLRFTALDARDWTMLLTGESLHGLVDALNAQVQKAGWALPPMPLQAAAAAASDSSPLH